MAGGEIPGGAVLGGGTFGGGIVGGRMFEVIPFDGATFGGETFGGATFLTRIGSISSTIYLTVIGNLIMSFLSLNTLRMTSWGIRTSGISVSS